VTGTLSNILVGKLAEHHDINVMPFINITPVLSDELKEEIKQLCSKQLKVVFTSNNGVETVAALIDKLPGSWELFSIEGVTSRAVRQYFGESSLAATALSADDLAKEILKGSIKEVVFFCGDLRRDELPERLRSSGVRVIEVIVYHTVATPAKVKKEYDAILFFSPSSVYSYMAMNSIPEKTTCFAIGHTTANTIKNIVNSKVLIALPPSKERVVEMVLEYYN
jgi:uroporphyrinogen-III synthase